MRLLSPLISVVLLTACGGEAARHIATITNVCSANGENPAECACVADSLKVSVGEDGLAAMANYLGSIDAAKTEAARRDIAMGVRDNATLMRALEDAARLGTVCAQAVAAGDVASEAGNGVLTGVYLPQLGDVPASERRLAASAADRRWEFTADGKVTTHSQGGARRWNYAVRGKEIRLTGAGPETQGERRLFTFHSDGRCIWDGRGNSSVDMRFCPS